MCAMLGLDANGTVINLRLTSPGVVHVLVAGTTGSGKTVLLRSMALSLALNNAPQNLKIVLLGGGQAFSAFRVLPHLLYAFDASPDASAAALKGIVQIMDDRIGNGWTRQDRPFIVVVIDELADLMMTAPEAEKLLTRICQRGRGEGIHVIAATQKPTAAIVGSLVKANFPARIVGKVADATDASVAAGRRETAAERLGAAGDFLLIAEGDLLRFQAGYVTESEVAQVLRGRGWTTEPSAVAVPQAVVEQDERGDSSGSLEERLLEAGWEKDWSINRSCREIGEVAGGTSWYAVKETVQALRNNGNGGTTTT